METRAFTVTSAGRTLKGYAARFNAPASIADFNEVIMPGAFKKTLAGSTAGAITALYEHDNKGLLGRVGSGTLRLSEDEQGLAFELDLPSTQIGSDVLELVKRGDLAGCSFGFIPLSETWQGNTRILNEVQLHEITLTATPAYPATSVSLRSARPRIALARRYLEVIGA